RMSMIPIQSKSPAFAQCEANGVSQDARDEGAQADDFSALLTALFILPPATPQTEQQVSPEDKSADGCETVANTAAGSLPLPAPPTQPLNFFVQPGIQTDEKTMDSRLRLNDIFGELQKIEGKPQVEQGDLIPLDNADIKPLGVERPLDDPAIFTARANIMHNDFALDADAEFPSLPPTAKFLSPVQVEATRLPSNFTKWQKEGFGNFSFSTAGSPSSQPAPSISSQAAAAFHILQNEAKAEPDSAPQPAPFEPVAQATGQAVVNASAALKGKAAPFIEKVTESSQETVEAPAAESISSTQTAPALNAANSPVAATHAASISIAQTVATQMAHALTETIREVSARREARSVRLRLHPEDLGEVQISVTIDGKGRLSAQIGAEHDQTRRAIADGLNHLRDHLGRAGVDLESLDINLSLPAGAESGTQTGTSSHQETTRAAAAASATLSPETTAGEDQLSTEEERLLSLRA
ncbi:MAG TPA: flagellar hook-length control protein FliK, partial [Pyrinomonadaceae bacterium]|nr:flagellar hook-length control protein FliK [Pyrinomonadaceae bacterium]